MAKQNEHNCVYAYLFESNGKNALILGCFWKTWAVLSSMQLMLYESMETNLKIVSRKKTADYCYFVGTLVVAFC